MSKSTTAPKRIGNLNTERVIGTAAQKLSAAVKQLLAVTPEIGKLDELIETNALKIVDQDAKIAELDQQLRNTTAQHKIEIAQRFEANEKFFVDTYLQQKQLITISQEEYSGLQEQVLNAESIKNDAVNKAVNAATGSMKSAHEAEKRILTLEFDKKEADNNAQLNQLKNQVLFLTEQVDHWKSALDAERNAGIERAKAGAIGSINVGGPK